MYYKLPKIAENEEYEFSYKTSNYKGLSRQALRSLLQERGLKGISFTRSKMVEILLKHDSLLKS